MKIAAAPRIMIVAALCAIGLVAVVVTENAARAGGLEIELPMEAVDPRALMSGHYVQLNLTQQLAAGEQCPPGAEDAQWVALEPRGDIYVLAGGSRTRGGAQQIAPVMVKGSFSCDVPTSLPGAEPMPGWVRLDLGIERFYISQAEAERIEHVLRGQRPGETRAFAIVSVGRDGRARLIGLVVDGERLELDWL